MDSIVRGSDNRGVIHIKKRQQKETHAHYERRRPVISGWVRMLAAKTSIEMTHKRRESGHPCLTPREGQNKSDK